MKIITILKCMILSGLLINPAFSDGGWKFQKEIFNDPLCSPYVSKPCYNNKNTAAKFCRDQNFALSNIISTRENSTGVKLRWVKTNWIREENSNEELKTVECWNEQDHFGVIEIEIPSALTNQCQIPDHNRGEWGCDTISTLLFHKANYASQIVITNLSTPDQPPLILKELKNNQQIMIDFVDIRDPEHKGLVLAEGPNFLLLQLFEYNKLISKEWRTIHLYQDIRF